MSTSGIVVGNPTATQSVPGNMPPEGPKVLPLTIPFTSQNTTFTLYGYQLLQQGQMTALQSMFVNNSGNTASVTVTVSVSNSTTVVPAGECQWIAVLAPSGAAITFTSTGAVTISAQITNFFVQPTGAGGGSSGGTYVNGALAVTDQALDATIANGVVKVQKYSTKTGDVLIPDMEGMSAYAVVVPSGSNYETFLNGGPYALLQNLVVSISADLSFGSAGTYLASLYDGSNLVAQAAFYVSATAPAASGSLVVLNLQNMQFRTQTSGGAVNLVLQTETGTAATISAGKVYATLFAGITSHN